MNIYRRQVKCLKKGDLVLMSGAFVGEPARAVAVLETQEALPYPSMLILFEESAASQTLNENREVLVLE